MDQNNIWNLVARKLSGEASVEELQELEAILRGNPDLHYSMQTIADLWNAHKPIDQEEADRAFGKHMDRMHLLNVDFPPESRPFTEKPRFSRKKIGWIASALLVLAVFVLVKLINNSSARQPELAKSSSEIFTRNGSKTNLVLPDGTMVWLNAGSRLTYDRNYGNTLREVNLSGEAFFDVVKNAEKPFIIHTGRINIKVLGTAFNVKSYPDEKTIETSLIRGSIEVTFKDRPSEKVILKPNEKLVVANEEVHSTPVKKQSVPQNNEPFVAISHLNYAKADNSIIETAWTRNKLIFQDKSFRDLAAEMERWYGVLIRFDNSERDTLHFTGSFENETIQQALDALKLTTGKSAPDFHYSIHGGEITITK